MDALRHIPLGEPLPASVHAVSCSLPTMRDACGYEEKDPRVMDALSAGYPRFFEHPYVRQVREDLIRRLGLSGRTVGVFPSGGPLQHFEEFVGLEDTKQVDYGGLRVLHGRERPEVAARLRNYQQHTGLFVYSRQAEDYLLERALLETRFEEGVVAEGSNHVLARLTEIFQTRPGQVFLTNSGMNAFYAGFRAVSAIQQARGRRIWVQLGWLYLDTMHILEHFTGPGDRVVISRATDLAALDALFRSRGAEIAGVVTEVPTNPLIECVDLPALAERCRAIGAPLLIDPTLATPYNIDVIPHCDVVINSLTKYAASEGDVIAGAIVVNPESPFSDALCEQLPSLIQPPYERDTNRLALQIDSYEKVVEGINERVCELARFLESQKNVRQVHWALDADSRADYSKIARRPEAPGGLFSIELAMPLAKFYDRIRIAKGPSFGHRFSLVCPFLYLAHYDLVTTEAGRAELRSHGLDPDLVRISVGLEDPDELIRVYEEALR